MEGFFRPIADQSVAVYSLIRHAKDRFSSTTKHAHRDAPRRRACAGQQGSWEHETGPPGNPPKPEKSCSNMVLQPFRGHNTFWLDTLGGHP
ncbi:hypothetical protein F4827_000960 [Paraburkholderia bannensis]|uniref:Uncharacterized protein n=1 Tax=Paraburkholderia bannensis TaxID=765414 RepID=A0A7W9TTT9_9BURK|nr:hypothetical protein [Paraburkholderia sp. WP4_3_2]MBB6101134.1 hypothetical protein [Paraburkholderia bannensis]